MFRQAINYAEIAKRFTVLVNDGRYADADDCLESIPATLKDTVVTKRLILSFYDKKTCEIDSPAVEALITAYWKFWAYKLSGCWQYNPQEDNKYGHSCTMAVIPNVLNLMLKHNRSRQKNARQLIPLLAKYRELENQYLSRYAKILNHLRQICNGQYAAIKQTLKEKIEDAISARGEAGADQIDLHSITDHFDYRVYGVVFCPHTIYMIFTNPAFIEVREAIIDYVIGGCDPYSDVLESKSYVQHWLKCCNQFGAIISRLCADDEVPMSDLDEFLENYGQVFKVCLAHTFLVSVVWEKDLGLLPLLTHSRSLLASELELETSGHSPNPQHLQHFNPFNDDDNLCGILYNVCYMVLEGNKPYSTKIAYKIGSFLALKIKMAIRFCAKPGILSQWRREDQIFGSPSEEEEEEEGEDETTRETLELTCITLQQDTRRLFTQVLAKKNAFIQPHEVISTLKLMAVHYNNLARDVKHFMSSNIALRHGVKPVLVRDNLFRSTMMIMVPIFRGFLSNHPLLFRPEVVGLQTQALEFILNFLKEQSTNIAPETLAQIAFSGDLDLPGIHPDRKDTLQNAFLEFLEIFVESRQPPESLINTLRALNLLVGPLKLAEYLTRNEETACYFQSTVAKNLPSSVIHAMFHLLSARSSEEKEDEPIRMSI